VTDPIVPADDLDTEEGEIALEDLPDDVPVGDPEKED
jgi:hypothetical protein